MKFAPALLALLFLVGCGKSAPSLAGRWNLTMGPTSMQVEFGSDGKYSGTMGGAAGAGQVSGTYSVKGNILQMEPPTVVGAGGSATPTGGTMKAKMISQGPDSILLDAGNNKFTLTRISP